MDPNQPIPSINAIRANSVIIHYFMPESSRCNRLGVFNAYDKSKADPEIHAFVKYLINWVAGTKIIFITLLIVI